SRIDGIRIIFKKDKMRPALAFSKEVKALGYAVFVQAVSITSYSDEDLKELIDLVNEVRPYAVSMVDTYGLLDSTGLDHIIEVIDRELDPGIALGYHAHNNFQLGYANVMSVLNTKTERTILVDGTLYGMGKSAGNAPIELIAMYMNRRFGRAFDVLQMQEAIQTCIMDLFLKKPWGYTLFYYIAAANNCHPDYVAYLMNKRTLSVSAINEILERIPEEEKLNKNMALIENLYLDYQATECNDDGEIEALKAVFFEERKVLVIGPGRNALLEKEKVVRKIREEQPLVVSINYLPEEYHPDILFLTNSRRYNQIAYKLQHSYVIPVATSNVKSAGRNFEFTLNYRSLIDESAEFPDNSLLMFLRLLMKLGVREVLLAGFDGYTPDDINYYDGKMAYDFVREKTDILNRQVKEFLRGEGKDLRVTFVTKSHYEE
ncbi:MAG: 3-hydroxy-3-methylglutaryl-CoA lyase, partial [Lachnospiraceae bacterium]|nr:3-hydroxy-3-methylglutaryl-CoA lyase [Lachnospiraceae bacterium]